MEDFKCLLLLTPSLVHLKLVSSRSKIDSIFDGSYWEQFIQNNLFSLSKFQFLFTCYTNNSDDISFLDSLILPFQSSFWLNVKHWVVFCDYIPRQSEIRLYTTSASNDIKTRSPKLEVSSINSKYRLLLYSNEDMDYNSREGTLTTIYLSNNQISDIGAQHLADTLQNHQVTYFPDPLYGEETNLITDTGAQFLADALQNNTTLEELKLNNTLSGYCAAVEATIELRNNKTITRLNLWEKTIGDEEVQHFVNALENNRVSYHHSFCLSHTGDNGVKYLCDALRNNITLVELNLGYNQIGDIGAQYLADTLKKNETLMTLNLELNQIGDAGAQQFAFALKNNKILKDLRLDGNKISTELQNRLETEDKRFCLTIYYDPDLYSYKK
ncbi:unnamed protein product [Adineta steineri]|uniref:Uncharacterized protein n=1 Tax=Adineta steineri TaxID=433720 RepID=A0A819QTZ6_9BILA|nr:unnamed protein product [Adineta steineri]